MVQILIPLQRMLEPFSAQASKVPMNTLPAFSSGLSVHFSSYTFSLCMTSAGVLPLSNVPMRRPPKDLLFFSAGSSVISKRKKVKHTDFWQLSEGNQADTIFKRFIKVWEKELAEQKECAAS